MVQLQYLKERYHLTRDNANSTVKSKTRTPNVTLRQATHRGWSTSVDHHGCRSSLTRHQPGERSLSMSPVVTAGRAAAACPAGASRGKSGCEKWRRDAVRQPFSNSVRKLYTGLRRQRSGGYSQNGPSGEVSGLPVSGQSLCRSGSQEQGEESERNP